jgi:hypothetical protein
MSAGGNISPQKTQRGRAATQQGIFYLTETAEATEIYLIFFRGLCGEVSSGFLQ